MRWRYFTLRHSQITPHILLPYIRIMRYSPLSASTYREHRARFRQAMEKGGLAIFHSNDIMPTSADG